MHHQQRAGALAEVGVVDKQSFDHGTIQAHEGSWGRPA
jgi:hypothetical protein